MSISAPKRDQSGTLSLNKRVRVASEIGGFNRTLGDDVAD